MVTYEVRKETKVQKGYKKLVYSLNSKAPYINYRINKDYFIDGFYENKEIPELKFERKCH